MSEICMLFPSSFPPLTGATFISEYTFTKKIINEGWNVNWICVDPNKKDCIVDDINVFYISANSTDQFSKKIDYISSKKDIDIYYTREYISALATPKKSKLVYLAQDYESYLHVNFFDIFFQKRFSMFDINIPTSNLCNNWPLPSKIKKFTEKNLARYFLFREIEKKKKNIIKALQKANFIIVLSDSLKEIIIKSGINKDKVKTVREGADINFFKNNEYKNEIKRKFGI